MQRVNSAVLILGSLSLLAGTSTRAQAPDPDPWHRAMADGVSFDSAYAWLRQGPLYRRDAPTGQLDRVWRDRTGNRFPYVVMVPPSYTPDQAWPVRVYLHGTVMRPEWGADEFFQPSTGIGYWRSFARWSGDDFIAVFPAGWDEAPWWSHRQVESLHGILTTLREEYNVDENRVHLLGFSDGGGGVWFEASRAPTLWASYNAWISHPGVVGTETTGSDGEFHPAALLGKPFYVVNTEDDPLYPAKDIAPIVSFLQERGVDIRFYRRPGRHGLAWLASEWPAIDAFLATAVRDPLPDQVSWQTTFDNRYLRNHWILVTELGAVSGEARFPPDLLFRALRSPGRLVATRDDNTIRVTTQGVRRLRILLSPAEIDFSRPVTIEINGVTIHRGTVSPDVETLRRWARIDHDRSMLFGAELEIEVPGRSQ